MRRVDRTADGGTVEWLPEWVTPYTDDELADTERAPQSPPVPLEPQE